MSKRINLGCGDTYHEDWVNIDLSSTSPHVTQLDLTRGLPFEDESADVVYTSHLIEHLSKHQAERLLREIYRTLKPGGILRIVVPDLERSVKGYLAALDAVRNAEDEVSRQNHEWAIIELIDQMVREESVGEMQKYCARPDLSNMDYIISRCGSTVDEIRKKVLEPANSNAVTRTPESKLGRRAIWLLKVLDVFGGVTITPADVELLRTHRSGEKHRWMYDEVSLRNLLTLAKFRKVRRQDAFHSDIPNWQEYRCLDVENDQVRKPDSLFMEASK